MPKSNASSPGRSLVPITPRRYKYRLSKSIDSPGRSGAKRTVVDQIKVNHRDSFVPSPLSKTVLSDNTDIEEPRRASWWKNVDKSRDIMEVLTDKPAESNNIVDEFDVEILSQENKENGTLDIPESSGSESIASIVVPQRKLFTQKEIPLQKKFDKIIGTRESLAKPDKIHIEDKLTNAGTKNLFGRSTKRSRPVFPAALLNVSPDKTLVNKTKEMLAVEMAGPSRNLFGNRAGTKRKNMFTDFIMSESEDEIPDIKTRRFTFTKQPVPLGHKSSASRGGNSSPASSITTDIELDDWNCLPSSTMMEHLLEDATTPGRRARLSKLIETKETINTNSTVNKSMQSDKSKSSKNKSIISNSAKKGENENIHNDTDKNDNESKAKHLSKSNIEEMAENILANVVGQEEPIDEVIGLDEDDAENITLRYDDDNQEECVDEFLNTTKVKKGTSTQIMAEKDKSLVSETPMPCKSKSLISKVINETPEAVLVDDGQQDNTPGIEQDKDAVFKPSQELERSVLKQNAINNKKDDQDIVAGEKLKEDDHEAAVGFDMVIISDPQDKSQNTHVTYAKNNEDSKTDTENHVMEVVEPINETEHTQKNKDFLVKDDEMNDLQKDIERSVQDEEQIEIHKRHSENEVIEENEEEIQGTKEQVGSGVENDNEIEMREIEDNERGSENEKNDEEMELNDEPKAGSDIENYKQIETEMEKIEDYAGGSEINDEEQNEEEVGENEELEESLEIDNEEQNEEEIEETQELEESLEIDNEEQNDKEIEENEEQEESLEIDNEEQNEEEIEENEEQDESLEIDNEEQNEEEIEENEEQDESIEIDDEVQNVEENEELDQSSEINSEEDSETENEDQEIENIEQNEEVQEEMEDDSHIPNTPNASHDTTGRNRNKNYLQSPEAVLFNKTNSIESFTKTKGRNTSIRKSILKKNFSIRPSIAPPRESTGISDGTKNSSTEGSGWDSHRNERKTLRLTLGKDFSPRKSLRALVMEKSHKRKTIMDEANADLGLQQANFTEIPVDDDQDSDHQDSGAVPLEVSLRTRQSTLEQYLQKKKKEYMERKMIIDENVRKSLMPSKPIKYDILNSKVPMKLSLRKPLRTLEVAPKPQRGKRTLVALEDLPPELIEDMKYKPPKRFRASNAPWITKRMYNFLESKLEPKYDYKARVRAEKLVESIYTFAQGLRKLQVASSHSVAELKREMARLDVVKTHYEFYNFFNEFMPREIRFKVVPDIVNQIPTPRNGVFSDILDEIC